MKHRRRYRNNPTTRTIVVASIGVATVTAILLFWQSHAKAAQQTSKPPQSPQLPPDSATETDWLDWARKQFQQNKQPPPSLPSPATETDWLEWAREQYRKRQEQTPNWWGEKLGPIFAY